METTSRLPVTLAVAIAVFAAGCITAPDDAGPEDGDDAGTSPADDDAMPGSDDDTPGNSFAPQEDHDEAQDDDARGLWLSADLVTCQEGYCINATAGNAGPATYHVSSICVTPWSERMEKEGDAVQHREPIFHCLAFGTEPFIPGEERAYKSTWDGRLWDEAAEAYVPAPEGAYQWMVAFRAYEDADGGSPHDLEISFTVVIGAT